MIDLTWLVSTGGICLLLGAVFGIHLSESGWKAMCIKHNVARYHPQTGKWEWTVEEKK